jgi:hypothetical protein
MDISDLDYSAKAEAGRFLQFVHPTSGAPMEGKDGPIGAVIKAFFAKSVMRELSAMARVSLTGKDDADRDDRAALVAQASKLTVELRGVSKDGKPIRSEGFAEFYDRTFMAGMGDIPGCFALQVLSEAQKAQDFLTDA